MITIYVDESGTHNNRYMIICAVITTTEASRKRLKRIMSKALVRRRSIEPAVDELHASKLDTATKQNIMLLLSRQHDYQVAYIVCDKKHLTPELKSRSNLAYNYLFNILFKKVVATFPAQDIRIISDNRSVSAGSKNSLPEYIMTDAYAKWGYTGNLSIMFCDSRDVKGLQVADLIANSIYAKYNLDKSHLYSFHDSHFVEVIKFPYATFGI